MSSKLESYRIMFHYVMRRSRKTTALLALMKQNPNAIMVVHSNAYGRLLAKTYHIDPARFVTVDNLPHRLCGKRCSDLVFDHPALEAMFTNLMLEQNAIQDTHNKDYENLVKKNVELGETHRKTVAAYKETIENLKGTLKGYDSSYLLMEQHKDEQLHNLREQLLSTFTHVEKAYKNLLNL